MFNHSFILIAILAAAAFSASAQELVGTWQTRGMSMIGDRNTVTGSVTPSNGNTQKYVFGSDGRFAFTGYLQSTQYGCTTALFNDKQGKYTLEGSTLTLTPSKNFWRQTFTCSPASNKERNYTLERETYDISTKTDEYGKLFICLANEKGETCYRNEK